MPKATHLVGAKRKPIIHSSYRGPGGNITEERGSPLASGHPKGAATIRIARRPFPGRKKSPCLPLSLLRLSRANSGASGFPYFNHRKKIRQRECPRQERKKANACS